MNITVQKRPKLVPLSKLKVSKILDGSVALAKKRGISLKDMLEDLDDVRHNSWGKVTLPGSSGRKL